MADGQHPGEQFIATAIRTVHHAQRGEGIQTAAYRRARDLRFLAELGNGQPLALGGEGVKDLQPAGQR